MKMVPLSILLVGEDSPMINCFRTYETCMYEDSDCTIIITVIH